MSQQRFASWSFVVASVLIGSACGGGESEPSASADAASDNAAETTDGTGGDTGVAATTESPAGEATSGSTDDAPDGDTAAGFGELIEGTFIFTGAVDERFYVSDDELAFRLGGGCQGDQFGFSVAVNDAAGETTFAMVTAQMQQDLSGGVIGEFEAVDAEITLLPGGDITLADRYEGPVRLVISEHDTGGASSDLNARRMTITLLGTVTGDQGDVDVDVTFRWVMGCP